MNKINVDIDFTNGTLNLCGIDLITGDYNSTEIDFIFDEEHQENRKVFEMKSPNEEIVMLEDIVDNKIGLFGLIDITTTHNDKTYIQYTKDNAVYWYNENDNELYDSEWNEVFPFELTEYTKSQQKASVFGEEGYYIFEVSCYGSDSKLTSVFGKIPVNKEQVIIGDEVVEPYLPIFDELIQEINEKITEANNLDLDVTDTSGVVEATLTKKDGTTKTVEIIDRNDYYDKDEVDAIQTTIEAEIPTKVSELDNDSNFIDNTVDDLTNYTKTSDLGATALSNSYNDLDDKPNLSVYSLITETGNKIDLEINSSTYVLTAKLYDKNNNLLSTSTGIDLPLETMVVGASYDSATKEIVLTLKNGQEVRFSVADLVSGLQTEITPTNKLASDLVDDTNSTNKFTNATEKSTWNNKLDNDDYASFNNGGTIKVNSDYATNMYNGSLFSSTKTYTEYRNGSNGMFIGKGTLENVITGKELTNKTYVDSANEEQDTQIEELQEENTYLNNVIDQLPRVNGSGTSITLNNTIEAKMKCNLSPSEMEQESEPTPSNPQDIHTTTGDNVIRDEGKNLLNKELIVSTNTENWEVNQIETGIKLIHKSSYSTGQPILTLDLEPNTTYTYSQSISNVSSGTPGIGIKTTNGSYSYLETGSKTITTESDGKINILYGSGLTNGNSCDYTNIQLEKGTSSSNYEPYNGTDYPLTLGTLEYSKIGNYEDEFIYNTTDTNLQLNKWYLKKNIGKVVLNGSENWSELSGVDYKSYYVDNLINAIRTNDTAPYYSNYFGAITNNQRYINNTFFINSNNRIIISYNDIRSVSDFETYLSTHNTILDYIRANPEYLPLNDTLQEQLTNIYNNMMSKKGTTNISQVANDLPMVITASALLDLNTLVQ